MMKWNKPVNKEIAYKEVGCWKQNEDEKNILCDLNRRKTLVTKNAVKDNKEWLRLKQE